MSRQKYPKATTISSLNLLKNKGELRIPEVQRDLVWTKSQKQLLIDSLFKDYDIPKLYFRDVNKNGKTVYDIIDGQQRLNAIFEFLNNEFELPLDSDDIQGEKVAGKKWNDLSSDLQIEFSGRALDVVHLIDYSDEEIDETFLRLQNGTPLKAAEKRRAIKGNMRNVISELAKDDIFQTTCYFDNSHYAFEDVTAKIMKQIMEGKPSSISAQSLQIMYQHNTTIQMEDKPVKEVLKSFNFLKKAFKNKVNPRLRKYAIMDLCVIANGLLRIYDISKYAEEFGDAYLDFTEERVLNAEKPEEEQDPRLITYSNATRGDSLELLEYRQRMLREYIIEKMPYLLLKDNSRYFTTDQRTVIYRRGGGICAICKKALSEEEFEADHIIPWDKGGPTQVANGQVLCSDCNKHKSDKLI